VPIRLSAPPLFILSLRAVYLIPAGSSTVISVFVSMLLLWHLTRFYAIMGSVAVTGSPRCTLLGLLGYSKGTPTMESQSAGDHRSRFTVIPGGRKPQYRHPIKPETIWLVCAGCSGVRHETTPFTPCTVCSPPRYGVNRFRTREAAEAFATRRMDYRAAR
jgi:hypothetical protein